MNSVDGEDDHTCNDNSGTNNRAFGIENSLPDPLSRIPSYCHVKSLPKPHFTYADLVLRVSLER
jgi:hypothetical protein